MFKKFLIVVLYAISLYGQDYNLEKDWVGMSEKEKKAIAASFQMGAKYNLGYTLAAINWHESKGGRWRISADGNDVGYYHVNVYWYLKENGIRNSIWKRLEYKTLLITNQKLELDYVISMLVKLRKKYKNAWLKIWRDYNGSPVYAKDILNKVIFLRKHTTISSGGISLR